MKIEKLNIKVGQKYILLDLLKKIPHNFINQKHVEIEIVDGTMQTEFYIYYKGADSFYVNTYNKNNVVEILEILINN